MHHRTFYHLNTNMGKLSILILFMVLCQKTYIIANALHQSLSIPAVEMFKTSYQCRCRTYNVTDTSTAIFKVVGRLGNEMMIYSLLLSLKRRFGFNVYMEQHVKDNLNFYFDNVNAIPSLDQLCLDSYPWETMKFSPLNFEDEFAQTGFAYEFPERLRLMQGNIIENLNWDRYLNEVEQELRLSFVFKSRFVANAQDILREIEIDHRSKRKKKKKTEEIEFVGIHVRRTDVEYLIKLYQMPQLKPSYYLSAIDLFRSKLKNPVFVLVGDDIEWARKNIVNRVRGVPIHIRGSSLVNSKESIGNDLALLTQCNHTVLSYGTFSMWAGILAGGYRVFPYMVLEPSNSKSNPLDRNIPTFSFPDYGLKFKSRNQAVPGSV